MALPDLIFIVFAVSAFTLYGVVLFTAWLVVEVLDRPKATAPAPAAGRDEPEPLRRAA